MQWENSVGYIFIISYLNDFDISWYIPGKNHPHLMMLWPIVQSWMKFQWMIISRSNRSDSHLGGFRTWSHTLRVNISSVQHFFEYIQLFGTKPTLSNQYFQVQHQSPSISESFQTSHFMYLIFWGKYQPSTIFQSVQSPSTGKHLPESIYLGKL